MQAYLQIMRYNCTECASNFREKKNVQQHLRKDHGIKKFKCKLCEYRTDDPTNLKRHEKLKHSDFVMKCKQCEYITNDENHMNRHVRAKHLVKNIKCEKCEFITDKQLNMIQHVNAKHTLKSCNECDFTTLTQMEMKKHKKDHHEPDNFEEKSAFNKLLYQKTWKVRGFKDPLSTLQLYKVKIQNTIKHYLETKGPMKWYLGMQVIFHKKNMEGEIMQTASPGFTSNPQTTLSMYDFDKLYAESSEKIMNDFVEFNANGSGWILDRVQLMSVHINHYSPIAVNDDYDTEDTDEEENY